MKISFSKPPIYDEAARAFEIPDDRVTYFTYGDTCFIPKGGGISDDLKVHEQTHMVQQEHSDEVAKEWWKEYLADPEFRFHQEAEAYAVQWKYLCRGIKDRNAKFRVLWNIAIQLSSGMYGHCCTHTEAMKMIRKYAAGVMHPKGVPKVGENVVKS